MTGDRIPERALIRLRARIRAVVGASEVPMDNYQPEEYVESELESCNLQEFRTDELPRIVELYAADDDDEVSYDVTAEIDGEGDILWRVTHPAGGDFERFASDMDGLEHGGGHFERLDQASVVRIRVSAAYLVAGKTWSDLHFDDVSLTPTELERRKRLHDAADYDYLVDRGVLPREPEEPEAPGI